MRELVESLSGSLGSWPIHAFLYTALLGGVVLLVERRLGSLVARETWLRVALFGGVFVAGAQLALDGRWSVARLPLSASEVVASRPVIGLAPGPRRDVPPAADAGGHTGAAMSPNDATPVPPPSSAAVLAPSEAPWPWLATLVALWAGVALARLTRLGLRRRGARAWLATRRPLRDRSVRERLQRLAPRGLRVRLSEHAELESPVALGAREICLPARAATDLDGDALDAVLAHELAHLLRRDDRWSLAAQVAEALALPFAPALRRRLQHVAELACDAQAADAVGELAVARGLERVAGWVRGGPALALGAAMARADSDLVSRVARVLERGGDVGRGRRRSTAAALMLVGALACVGPRAGEPAPPVEEEPKGDPLEIRPPREVEERPEPEAHDDLASDFFVGRNEPVGRLSPPRAPVGSPQVHVGAASLLVRDAGSTEWIEVHDRGFPSIDSPAGRPSLLEWLAGAAARMEKTPDSGFPAGRLSISTDGATRMRDVLTVMARCADFEVRLWNLVLVGEGGREWKTPLPHDLGRIAEAIEEEEGGDGWTNSETRDSEVEALIGRLEPVERPEIQVRVVEAGTKVALDGGAWSGAGPYRYDTDRVLEYRAGPRKLTLAELSTWLAGWAEESPGVDVILNCMPGVVYRDVLQVLDILVTHDLSPIWVGAYAEVYEDPPPDDK